MMKIVSRDGCPYCDKAIDLMQEKGDEYEVFKLTTQDQINLYRFLGHKTVPYIVGVGGYNDLVEYYKEKGR